MDILSLLNALVANVSALQAQLVDAQAAVDSISKAKFDEGFAAGVASVGVPAGDKIFSQAELDLAVAQAVAPLQAQIDSLNAQIVQVQGEVDAKVQAGIAGFKVDLLAKYDAQQASESQGEVDFRSLFN